MEKATRMLCSGNDAVGWAAIYAGCRNFYGYPITPQSEIMEFVAREFPARGNVFIQAESEAAAAFMLYAGSLTGQRCMTATSGPGFSLMQEAISHMSVAEAPSVIVEVNRLGPGAGTVQMGQTDYRQTTSGGGHGGYRCLVLGPSSCQEVFDLTQRAFHLADKYRMTVIVLTDFILGRGAEVVDAKAHDFPPLPPKDWALIGKAQKGNRSNNIGSALVAEHGDIPKFFQEMKDKYDAVAANETRYETFRCEDAKLVVVAYGSVARVVKEAVEMARARGLKVGLLRPITLWPFPSDAIRDSGLKAGQVLVVEDNQGQMVEDVEKAVRGGVSVHFLGLWARHLTTSSGLIFPERVLEEMERLL